MLNKNSFMTGILLGTILPAISVAVFELLMNPVWVISKRGAPYFAVVAANLLILRYFAKKQQERTVQGMILVSFAFLILVYIYRYR